MAVFEYQAIGSGGKTVKGIIDADSAAAARRKLRDQELHPTQISETFAKGAGVTEKTSSGRVSIRDIALLTRQLAVLLEAGMPLTESMGALLDQTSNTRLRKTVYDVRSKVTEGVSLGEALRNHPRLFSPLYVNMVSAGESSGALEQVLLRLADILERQMKLRHRIQSMLFYPAFLSIFGICMVAFLMTVIVPRIVSVFARQNMALPTVTKVLMGMCDFLSNYWWGIILFGGVLFVLWRTWVSRDAGRRQWDRFRLRLPLVGPLYVKIICVRFARTLGTMLSSGLTMMTALDVVSTVVQNTIFEDAVENIKTDVRRGRDLSLPLRESGIFPAMLIHMTELGQRSGKMEAMLAKTADIYEEDVEVSVEALVNLLDPLIIITMGIFVGFLVFAILLPIFDMSSGI